MVKPLSARADRWNPYEKCRRESGSFRGSGHPSMPGRAPSLSIRSNVMAGSGLLQVSDEAPKAW